MTALALFDPKARPDYALAKVEPSALTKALTGGGGFPGKRISIKGGVFRLISDGKEIAAIEDRYLDVVLVRAAEHIGRTYYNAPYDEDKPSAPSCWSADGVKPDSTSANLQSPLCAVCPQNVKGSGNDESRACRFSQRVAVVLANDMEGDVLQLSLPAASLFGKEEGDNRPLQAYARHLAANTSSVEQFITRLKFDLKASNPKLFFKAMRWLSVEEFLVAQEKGTTDAALQCVTMTVVKGSDVLTKQLSIKPVKALLPVASATLAAPAVDEEPPAPAPSIGRKKKTAASVEAGIAEPKVKATPAAAHIPTRTNVAEVAAGWTDD